MGEGNSKTKLSEENLNELITTTDFSSSEIQSIYRDFMKNSKEDSLIGKKEFTKIISKYFPQCDAPQIAEEIFQVYVNDMNKEGKLPFRDFLVGMSLSLKASSVETLRNLFNLYDVDRNGDISIDELQRMSRALQKYMRRNQQRSGGATAITSIEDTFKLLDLDDDGRVTFEEFQGAIQRNPDLMNILNCVL